MTVTLNGAALIAGQEIQSAARFAAQDAVSAEVLPGDVSETGPTEVESACRAAQDAAPGFADLEPQRRAAFLEVIAEEIEASRDALVARAMLETGLPQARLEGETGRTAGQLRLFACHVRAGDWAGRRIDPAQPDRAPLPRPDLRQRRLAIGPVAVFGASNFPLAFSVAGGDTASAFAAGCPVIVKGHPGHPGTGELAARAIVRAVERCGLEPGIFSYLPGSTHELGAALVAHPRIAAVGFTGSRQGGLALQAVAAMRAVPIPVYAEMSAVNPVILFPAALAARGDELAAAYVASLAMGSGQFCTNPGLVLALAGPDLDAFVAAASTHVEATAAQPMLTRGIADAFEAGMAAFARGPAHICARGKGDLPGRAGLVRTTAAAFRSEPALAGEIFGPVSLVVACTDMSELTAILADIEGQLTATLHIDRDDEEAAAALMPILERKVGRILANGWPTGVEVCDAMVHGGPYPATTDGRTTSVGTSAIERFLRPVCYQNLPGALLPRAVADANDWGLPEKVDGILSR